MPKTDSGLKKLIEEGKKTFRIEENTRHYSKRDYKQAEKLFVKHCIIRGECRL